MLGELLQLSLVHGHEKDYRVLLARRPDQEQLDAWRRGVILEDGYKTQTVDVRFENAQGKGAGVRVRIGSLRLGNLNPRQ